jgi:hypothetical protein
VYNIIIYSKSLYLRYPARAPTASDEYDKLDRLQIGILPGSGRSGMEQAMFQLAALGVTLGISLIGGALTG